MSWFQPEPTVSLRLLDAAGLRVPASMQGRSVLPLLDRRTAGWRNEVYFEMSEFITGRGLRTPEWTYAVAAPKRRGWKAVPAVDEYVEYMMYDLAADPFQHVHDPLPVQPVEWVVEQFD